MRRLNRMMIVFALCAAVSVCADVRADDSETVQKTYQQGEIKGRVDSIRPEKIVITYDPADQAGVTLQTSFLRDENTQFLKRGEGEVKTGDVVTVAYEEARWQDEEGKNRVERTARTVSFVYTREIAELKREVSALEMVSFRSGDEEGPQ
jgi:hypothetical protein